MQPTISTANLVLRPLDLQDAPRVQLLAGDSRVSDMTENIPYPYKDGMAENWIETLGPRWGDGTAATFAICSKTEKLILGCCGLRIFRRHNRATLGYWIGVEFWGNGVCTEAAREIVTFGFKELSINRIQATHLTKNPASGAVMRKIGMKHEATMTDYVIKNGSFEDMELYSVLSHRGAN